MALTPQERLILDEIESRLSTEDPRLEERLSRGPRFGGALTRTVWLATVAVILVGILLAIADRVL